VTAGRGPAAGLVIAGLRRRLLSLVYEALILAAVLLAAAVPMVMLTSAWDRTLARLTLQGWLLVLCGGFYVRQWTGSGQTLPMKTWRIKLVTAEGSAPGVGRALARYGAALFSIAALGIGYLWALIDRDRQFLHDRLAGTRLVVLAE
jgi:uncharacterized RDD family membrane protein YckC